MKPPVVEAEAADIGVMNESRLSRPAGPGASRIPISPGVVVASLAVVTLYVVVTMLLIARTPYETWSVMLMGPTLIVVSLPLLARQSAREGDRSLFWFLILALLVKFLGTAARLVVEIDLYDRVADPIGYHREGAEFAEQFRAGDFDTGLSSLVGHEFIWVFTGALYTVIGTSQVAGSLFYSWLAFLGLFLFYRAFLVAVPEGRARSYARLLFFLPTMVFWSSGIGKDAWMVFSLGVACYGVARVLSGSLWPGTLYVGLGLWLAAIVRPHVAAIVAVSLAAAYVVRRSRPGLKQLGPVIKGISIVGVVLLALAVSARAERFLHRSGIDLDSGLASALEQSAERTTEFGGGSTFVPSVVRSPARLPIAGVTVLFRPLLFDAHNWQAGLVAVEGTVLLLLSLFRWRWALGALRSVRRQPYVAFAFTYTILFVVAFSSIANFGLLVRQRVQVLPLFLLFLVVPPPTRAEPAETRRSRDAVHESSR